MQLFWKVQRKIIFSILAILLSFSIYVTAQENDTSASVVTGEEVNSEKAASEEAVSEEAASEEEAGEEEDSQEEASEEEASEEVTSEEVEEDLFGASLDLGYVGPDVWAGFQVSEGTRIQPLLKFSFHPDFSTFWHYLCPHSIGIFWNIYGSEKDRKINTKPPPDYLYGKYTKGLGMCDEVLFFIDWSHEWNWFSNEISFWYLAYTWKNNRFGITAEDKSICQWFGNMSNGEVTISPSINLGPFSIFTHQNLVIVSKERKIPRENNTYEIKNALWDYHGVFGLSYSINPVEQCTFDLGVFTEWASEKFLKEWLDSGIKAVLKNRDDLPYGIYHVTFAAAASYEILPQLSISGNFNVEYITNHWIRINDVKRAKGCIPYGGLCLTYTYGW